MASERSELLDQQNAFVELLVATNVAVDRADMAIGPSRDSKKGSRTCQMQGI
jgi:hypothetical protein